MAERVQQVKGPGARPPRGVKPQVKNPMKIFTRIMKYALKDYTVHCIAVVIAIFVNVLANVQGTMFMQRLIDDYITPLLKSETKNYTPLLDAIGRVACFYGIGIIASYSYNRIMVNVTQGMLKTFRDAMFTKMEQLPIKYFDTHAHGDIMSMYTNDTDTLRQMISQSMPQLFNSAITIISTTVCMFMLNIPLTALTFFMVGIMLVLTRKIGGLSAKHFIAQQKDIGTVNGYIEEMMQGQRVVKVFCHEEESKEAFDKLNDALCESSYKANNYSNILGPINAQLGNISYVLCAIVGGVLAIGNVGGFTLGGLASFLTFNKNFNMPINQISMQINAIVMALAGAERIFNLIDEKPEEVEYKDATEKKAIYYEQDAPYIISAFRREYQVNLLSVPYMHWWEFRILLDGLSEESQIKKRIYWRTCDVSKMEKKERMEILKIRRSITIPEEEYVSDEDIGNAFM